MAVWKKKKGREMEEEEETQTDCSPTRIGETTHTKNWTYWTFVRSLPVSERMQRRPAHDEETIFLASIKYNREACTVAMLGNF